MFLTTDPPLGLPTWPAPLAVSPEAAVTAGPSPARSPSAVIPLETLASLIHAPAPPLSADAAAAAVPHAVIPGPTGRSAPPTPPWTKAAPPSGADAVPPHTPAPDLALAPTNIAASPKLWIPFTLPALLICEAVVGISVDVPVP